MKNPLSSPSTASPRWRSFQRVYSTIAATLAFLLLAGWVAGFGPGGRACKIPGMATSQAAPAVSAAAPVAGPKAAPTVAAAATAAAVAAPAPAPAAVAPPPAAKLYFPPDKITCAACGGGGAGASKRL